MDATRQQIAELFVIAVPVAAIAWTVTHEEVFREFHELCLERSQSCRRIYARKFFYLFTCEYCFSHYVAAAFLAITRYKLLFPDWRGYLISEFSLVWVANVYIAIFSRLRLDLKKERVEISKEETAVRATKDLEVLRFPRDDNRKPDNSSEAEPLSSLRDNPLRNNP